MANPFSPHFVGWFGVAFPVVIRTLDRMPPPTAIRRMPPRYRDSLMATLAWDLADRLKFGIALAISPYKDFDWKLEDDPNLWGGWIGWAVRDHYLRREGCVVGGQTRPALNHFLSRADRRPPEDLTYAEHMEKYAPEDFKFMQELQRRCHDASVENYRGMGLQVIEEMRLFDPQSLFCGRNLMLHDGAPYFLRNNDFGWYSEYTRRVVDRFSIRGMDRWLALRDQTNNLVVADLTPNFKKTDHWFAAAIRGECEDPRAEHYGIRDKDAVAHKISGVRGSCREQDEYGLNWFKEKGLQWNPYTQWLHELVQLQEKSPALIDWDDVKNKARHYVPRSPYENHEMRLAQLYWCLSRGNPKHYAYRSPFRSKDRAKREAALRKWWERANRDVLDQLKTDRKH